MHQSLSVGYYGVGFDSPAYKLTELHGDYLEKINSGDKLALVAVLAGWLSEDADDYTLHKAMDDCNMCASPYFGYYLGILANENNHISPNDALGLISALTQQLRQKVFAE